MKDITNPNLRNILFSTAYKMLGEVSTSEDMVQDVLSKILVKTPANIQNQRSYLVKMVINHSLNYLNRQKKIRENYHGTWLPEPIIQTHEQIDYQLDVDYGMTVLLSQLTPQERAVFILRTSFDYPHAEIGELLDLSAAHVRKLFQRAQPKVQDKSFSTTIDPKEKEELISSFLTAISTGDIQLLISKLKSDIVLYSDGGGKVAAAKVPLYGEICTKFLLGLYQKNQQNMVAKPCFVNNELGIMLFLNNATKPDTIGTFDIKDGQIQNIYFIRNPEKISLLVTH